MNETPPTCRDAEAPLAAASQTSRCPGADSPRVVRSESLLAGEAHLAILHNETIYFLRQTRFGKLILTK